MGGDLSARFNVAAEVFAETSARFSDTDAAFNAGGRWRLGSHGVCSSRRVPASTGETSTLRRNFWLTSGSSC